MRRKQYAILISMAILLVIFVYTRTKPYYVFFTKTVGVSPLKALMNKPPVKQENDEVSILILGKPDNDHEGPNLTDSIIVATYNIKTNTLVTIGIPRDYWSPTLEDKINTAYAYGEARDPGNGLELAKKEVSAIVNKPIQYGVVISFGKFEALIDAMGGIEVDVPHAFTDDEFPIPGKENDTCFGERGNKYACRYKTVSFEKGKTNMDGETALTYVRSRHASGTEGSDFARSQRQQVVISAVKEKLIKMVKEEKISKIGELYTKANELFTRDITNQEGAVLAKDIIVSGNFKQVNLSIPRDLLETPEMKDYNGQFVLIPSSQKELDAYLKCAYEKLSVDKCYEVKK